VSKKFFSLPINRLAHLGNGFFAPDFASRVRPGVEASIVAITMLPAFRQAIEKRLDESSIFDPVKLQLVRALAEKCRW
jgi:hypothetical protein